MQADRRQEQTEYTGYPSIDRPWLKYYDEEFLKKPLPEMTLLEYVKANSGHRKTLTALSYFGRKISYAELFENIDSASKVFWGIGVRENDRILFLMPNIPETAYMMYGASQIGAVCDFIDPRPDSVDLAISAEKIYEMAREERIKYIVALEQCYAGMLHLIEDKLLTLGIEKIITVSAADSMNGKAKWNYLMENLEFGGWRQLKTSLQKQKTMGKWVEQAVQNSRMEVLRYQSLIKKHQSVEIVPAKYRPGRIALIVHTSGTASARPKPIPLTDDNVNSYVHQSFGVSLSCDESDRMLQILPYFAAYGVTNVVHNGLCRGVNLIQVPEFAFEDFGKLIWKYKPQIVLGVPTWFLSLLSEKGLRNKNLSFLKTLIFGGDSMEVADEEKINNFLKEHQCKCILEKGHGMSETSGAASYAAANYNDLGSLGIPFPHTIYAIVDPETREMIPWKEGEEFIEGELIISSKAVTPGVLDGKVIVPHVEYDGQDYICTGDLARMDRDGKMWFLSRKDRGFTRYDGFKIKPFEIENIIKTNGRVKYCVITSYMDANKHGNMPMAHIVLSDGQSLDREGQVRLVEEIIRAQFVLNPDVSARQIPTKFRFRDTLPFTANGKINFKQIEKEGLTGDEVTVEMEETNIAVGEIRVY